MSEVSLLAGKKINASSWSPNTQRDVTIFVSSNALDNDPTVVLLNKGDSDYWMSGDFVNSYIMFNFTEPVIPHTFEFSIPALDADETCRFTPQKIVFYGSNNGYKWDSIGSYEFESITVKDKVFRCEVDCKKVYQFLKVQQDGQNMAGTDTFTLSYINILSKSYTRKK